MKAPALSLCVNTVLMLLVSLMPMQRARAQTTGAGEQNVQAFRREVKETAELLRLPGLSVAVVQDGRIIYRQHEGYADLEQKIPIRDDSIFWLASVAKTFSGVLMMQYEQERKLSLEDPLIEYPFTSVGFLPQRIDPNVRLKHVLSHTSESVPGDTFVYHGGRFNFVSGVFEKLSGRKSPQAFPHEISARILQPLGMKSTLAGYPEGDVPAKARIVTPHAFNPSTRTFVANRQDHALHTAYPATGLLSSVDDLAAYTTALDGDRLLRRGSYERMTSPFVTNKGRLTPHGIGWFTQRVAGVRLHWAYGLGNADSSLLLRVPDKKLTLIVLSNSRFASEPFVLGGGHVMRSPFATSFFKHFVLQDDRAAIDYGGDVAKIRAAFKARERSEDRYSIHQEELLAQALARTFVESRFGSKTDQTEALVKLLYEADADFFMQNDPAVIHLLSQHGTADLDEAEGTFISSYDASRQFHPWIVRSIARRYERKGDLQNALKYNHLLADTPGFEEQEDKIEACANLARHYEQKKKFDKAREYAWRAFVSTRQAGYDDAAIQRMIGEINRLAAESRGAPGS